MIKRLSTCAIVCLLISKPAFAATELKFPQTWQLTEAEPEQWAHDEAAVQPQDLVGWAPYTQPTVPPGINKTIWIKNQIPELKDARLVLYLPNGLEDVAIYLDNRLVYSFGQFTKAWDTVAPQRWHMIPLTIEDSHKTLFIRTHYGLSYVTRTLYPHIRPQDEVSQELISSSWLTNLIAGALLLVGFLSLCVALARRRIDLFLYFGIMGLGISSWIMFNQDSVIKPFLGVPVGSWMYFDLVSIYVSEICIISFLLDIPKLGRRVVKILLAVNWIMFTSVTLISASHLLHGWYTLPLLHIAVFPTISILVPLIGWSAIRGNVESQVMMVGGVGVSLSVIHDVLRYTGTFDSPVKTMIPFGALIIVAAMVIILARRYKNERDQALNLQEKLNRELEKEVEVVERLVYEKTREIASMLEHIQQGIFMLVEPGLIIQDGYSRFLEDLLETKQLGRQSFESAFLSRCNLGDDQKSQIIQSLGASIGEDIINFEVNSGNLLLEVVVNSSQADKIVELSWAPILNKMNVTDKILVTARDVTGVRVLQKVAAENQEELRILLVMMSVNPLRFSSFLRSSQKMLHDAEQILTRENIDRRASLKEIFRDLHTIKGNARLFELEDLANVIHSAEQIVQNMQKSQTTDQNLGLQKLVSDALHKVDAIVAIFAKKFNPIDAHLVQIERTILEKLLFAGQKSFENPILQNLEKLIAPKVFTAVQDFFVESTSHLKKLAHDLGKPEPKMICRAQNIYFAEHTCEILQDVFGHLFRNALDHGIEAPELRLKLGKSADGLIQIDCNVIGDRLRIALHDDGQGIDLEKLAEKARKNGFLQEPQSLNERMIEDLLFAPGFSTKTSVSLISGRGIGLDVVRTQLESVGGQIHLQFHELSLASGTAIFSFILQLPAGCYYELSQSLVDHPLAEVS